MNYITFEQEVKRCKDCREVKPVRNYYLIKTVLINPYDVYCIECRKKRSLRYYFNKGKIRRRESSSCHSGI